MDFWDFFWLLVWSFFFVAYLMVLFQIIGDLFRDRELNGGMKALWIAFLLIFPFLSALIYLIARGPGMAERQMAANRQTREATDEYIRSVAHGPSAADQIAAGKQLLDSGAISQAEYDQLKARALSSV